MTSSTYFVYNSKAAANASKPTMVARGSNPSGAARKAATRGMKTILVRKAGTDKLREYSGTVKKLSTPVSVKIGNRVVKFRTQAKAVPVRG